MKTTQWVLSACAVLLVIIPASTAGAQILSNGGEGNVGEFGEVFGAGSMTCAQWLSSNETKRQGANWILGWWTASAADDSKSKLPANKANETKILKESSDLCEKKPEAALTNAIAEIYFKLEHGKPRRPQPR